MRSNEEETIYREEQRLVRYWPWIWLLVLPAAGLIWYGFIQQIVLHHPFGNNPGPDLVLWILAPVFGLGFPLLLYSVRLVTRVTSDSVRLTYFPLFRRNIHLAGVRICEAVAYHPLRDYGGWGVRWSTRNGWVFSAAGDQGVRLTLVSGKQILIGSHDPEQLAYAIQGALRHSRH